MARRSNAARRDASAARRREGIRSQPLSKALCRRFGGEMPSARATEPPLAPHPVDSTLPPDLRHSVLSTSGEKCGFSPPAFSFALPPLVAVHRTHESRNNTVAGNVRIGARGADGRRELWTRCQVF